MQSLQTFLCLAMLFLGIGFPQTQSGSLDLTFPCATFLYFSMSSCFHIAACNLHRKKQEPSVCSVSSCMSSTSSTNIINDRTLLAFHSHSPFGIKILGSCFDARRNVLVAIINFAIRMPFLTQSITSSGFYWVGSGFVVHI
jgi:hypothetical protein